MFRTTAHRSAAAIGATALGLGLLPLVAAPAQAATGCQLDCIGPVNRTITPEKATLALATTVDARVRVTFIPFSPSGPQQTSTSTGTAHVAATTAALPQGQTVRYEVVATDANGASWQETGYFTTSVRTVSVNWAGVAVTDDSDSGGPGEIGADGRLQVIGSGGVPTVCQWKGLAPFPATGNTFRSTDSSGTQVLISDSANLVCEKTPATGVEVGISMIDNDVDAWDTCDVGPAYPWGWFGDALSGGEVGTTNCWDWNNGITALPFPQTGAQTGTQSKAFSIASQPGHLPAFSATGTATFTVAFPTVILPTTTTGPADFELLTLGTPDSTTKQPRLMVNWSAPAVTIPEIAEVGVIVREQGSPSAVASVYKSGSSGSHQFSVPGGKTYDVSVVGINAAGTLAYARTTTSVFVQGPPAAPVNLTATPGDGQVALAWQPGANNGAPITDYQVLYRKGGDAQNSVADWAPGTSRTITGLVNGAEYTFWVRARNGIGTFGADATVKATPVAPVVPPAPEPPVVEPPVVEPPAEQPPAPAPQPGASTPVPNVAPAVVVSTGAKRRDGRAAATVTGSNPSVASVSVAWCDTRVSGKACNPLTARKRGASGPLAGDGTLVVKLTTKRTSLFNGTATAASFGGIKARKADRIRVIVTTTFADGQTQASPVQVVRL